MKQPNFEEKVFDALSFLEMSKTLSYTSKTLL